jgi:hypothetical protein
MSPQHQIVAGEIHLPDMKSGQLLKGLECPG